MLMKSAACFGIIVRGEIMNQLKKKELLRSCIKDKLPIEFTLYGQLHIKCVPVRLIGNVINYKTLRGITQESFKFAKVSLIPLVSIHKIEVL